MRAGTLSETLTATERLGHSLIATILAAPHLLDEVPLLEVDDFTSYRHRLVWTAIRNLAARGRAISVEAIDENLRDLDIVRGGTTCYRLHCGAEYLRALAATDPTSDRVRDAAHVRAWANVLRRARLELDDVAGDEYATTDAATTDENEADPWL